MTCIFNGLCCFMMVFMETNSKSLLLETKNSQAKPGTKFKILRKKKIDISRHC